MIQGRDLTMDDYVGMLRRQAKKILIPALVAPLVGFAVSYAFSPRYTSTSTILVEGQKVPESMVQPVASEDLTSRMAKLQQRVMSQANLQRVVDKVYPGKSSQEASDAIDAIRLNTKVEPVVSDLSLSQKKPGQSPPAPAFSVQYTATNAREAQQICNELTSLIINENATEVQASATGTSLVLNQGLEDAKRNLDDLDAKLAEFKKKYVGQLPGDEDNNLKILSGLNAQLEANTQTLNRAQQDKAYAESILAQQLGAWKSSQSSTNPQTLEKQLSDLQSELLALQARYTPDHPDVIKVKADIAEVKKKLAEVNKAAAEATDASGDKPSASEPVEIRQLRLQLHQYGDLIVAATRDQKRFQEEIDLYQSRISLSPGVEEQYKALTRDYDNGQKAYQDLLASKARADLTVKMNNQSEGERMYPLNTADLPDAPSFPIRLFFAGGGLAAGLGLGGLLAMGLEVADKSIRTEADAEAVLELPLLIAIPWVGATDEGATNGKHGKPTWPGRKTNPDGPKDAVGA